MLSHVAHSASAPARRSYGQAFLRCRNLVDELDPVPGRRVGHSKLQVTSDISLDRDGALRVLNDLNDRWVTCDIHASPAVVVPDR